MRPRWWLLAVWVCFVLRGWWYASLLPLWEGYDEFAHFGVLRAMANGKALPPRDQPGPRDVEKSLRLAPIPWEVRGWDVFRSSLTQEQYWSLPPAERRARESELRSLPEAWQAEESTAGISAYEALQPPLSYWLMAPVVWLLQGAGLLTQVMVVRWLGVLIASAAIPLTYAIARSVLGSVPAALGCSAVVAIMPGLALNVARISNEPLSILLFSLLVWIGLRILERPNGTREAALLGLVLGLGLLTKAYFLTAVPAVAALAIYRYRRQWQPIAALAGTTAMVAGWWHVRNLLLTGTVSGLAEPILLRGQGLGATLSAAAAIPWAKAVDIILVSHLYFCGWSSLTVRSWMYHVFFVIIAVVLGGLVVKLRSAPAIWLAAVYGLFWLGQLYNVVLQYLTKGLPGSMGWYLYAVVACEVVLSAVAFSNWSRWGLGAGVVLFGLLDLYGMHALAIPYYSGLIGHRVTGALATVHWSDYQAASLFGVFDRLAVNKSESAAFLVVLWTGYVAATLWLIVVAARNALSDHRLSGARSRKRASQERMHRSRERVHDCNSPPRMADLARAGLRFALRTSTLNSSPNVVNRQHNRLSWELLQDRECLSPHQGSICALNMRKDTCVQCDFHGALSYNSARDQSPILVIRSAFRRANKADRATSAVRVSPT